MIVAEVKHSVQTSKNFACYETLDPDPEVLVLCPCKREDQYFERHDRHHGLITVSSDTVSSVQQRASRSASIVDRTPNIIAHAPSGEVLRSRTRDLAA